MANGKILRFDIIAQLQCFMADKRPFLKDIFYITSVKLERTYYLLFLENHLYFNIIGISSKAFHFRVGLHLRHHADGAVSF